MNVKRGFRLDRRGRGNCERQEDGSVCGRIAVLRAGTRVVRRDEIEVGYSYVCADCNSSRIRTVFKMELIDGRVGDAQPPFFARVRNQERGNCMVRVVCKTCADG